MRNLTIVDTHIHLGQITAFQAIDPEVNQLLHLMDHLGIDLAIQMHSAGFVGLFEEAYTASEDAYQQSEGRIHYAPVFHVHQARECILWIEKSLIRPGCVGLKIHPSFHRLYADAPEFEPAWQLAADHGLPIISHSWAPSENPVQKFSFPPRFERYVADYPNVNLVLAHAGGLYAGHLAAVDLVRRYPNVYVDISGDCFSLGLVTWLVEQVGAERILFGSDLNWIDPRTSLGRVLDADITLDQKRKILSENALRVFTRLSA